VQCSEPGPWVSRAVIFGEYNLFNHSVQTLQTGVHMHDAAKRHSEAVVRKMSSSCVSRPIYIA